MWAVLVMGEVTGEVMGEVMGEVTGVGPGGGPAGRSLLPGCPLLGCAELSGGPPWDTSTIFTDCLALVCI